MIRLTPDQTIVLDEIRKFIHHPIRVETDVAAVLCGAAGCGKSFLTKVIVKELRGTHRIAGVAPTHKARKVLDGFLNGDGGLLKIKTMTVASLLNKMRSHSYIGTQLYNKGTESKIHLFDFFLIDEVSMIHDKDFDLIMNYAFQFKRRLLFIGDPFQIPNPSQRYICANGWATKRDSKAFELGNKFLLTTNVRQNEENPIVDIYTEMRDAIEERREPVIDRTDRMNGEQGVRFYTDQDKWYDAIREYYRNLGDTPIQKVRILSYTNDAVKNHNMVIRRLFQRGATPEVGELLMGYKNVGWPEEIIGNGQDYLVKSVTPTSSWRVLNYTRIVGLNIVIKETMTDKESSIFIPDISAPENTSMLQELVRRADKVNAQRSTKKEYKLYMQLKGQLVFMENIYNYNGNVISESEFRTGNPLLFKSVRDTIRDTGDGDRKLLDNKLTRDITERYGEILSDRLGDDKSLSASEKLCDRYCVIEKDLDYGFCVTTHKCQGSNFTTVFVDEADFDKIQDCWSYALDCIIDSSKERNQLKYVACTRPTTAAHIIYRP
jgi:hypothetical protein